MTIRVEHFQELLESPRLLLYAREIQAVLEEESQSRQVFYEQITEDEKAEFINGKIIIHSPAMLRHNTTAKRLLVLLDAYVQQHDLGYVGYEKIMISLTRNDYEPDICYFEQRKAAQFVPEQLQFPAPDFITEVLSESTEEIDRGIKFDDYAAHDVTEYWIVDPVEESVEQYQLQDDVYDLVVKAKTGQLESIAVPGFEIPLRSIFEKEENQATLRQILST